MKTTIRTIDLYRVTADYLTLTSWNEDFYQAQLRLLDQATSDEKQHQVAQYMGIIKSSPLGSVFVGDAIINGRTHYIAQISGSLADSCDIWGEIANGVKSGRDDITRLDVQMTIPEPADWKQVDFWLDRKGKGKTVGWAESTDAKGRLTQTVYVGARNSGRFLRLYEKLAGDTRLLRCEWEIKRPYSDKWGRQLAAGSVSLSQIFRLYLDETRHDGLQGLYMPYLHGILPASKVKIIKEDNKTEVWLKDTVLPVFARVINDHGSCPEIKELFRRCIENSDKWGEVQI